MTNYSGYTYGELWLELQRYSPNTPVSYENYWQLAKELDNAKLIARGQK